MDDGADVKATDAQGRTALHWTIFGSSYNTKPSILVAYEEIADALIARGVDINREDVYQDTALDYLLYSPSFEIQTLLIEHGATSGFLAASFHFFIDERTQPIPKTLAAAVSLSRKADLTPGQTLSVRLNIPVYSDRSRTGDPITATVTYPLCKNGEQMSCNPRRAVDSAGDPDQRHHTVCAKGAGQILQAAARPRFLQHSPQGRREVSSLCSCA